MNNKIINKIYSFLVVIIFCELILGGLGNLFGLPIRKGLFVLGILSTIFVMVINKVKLKKIYIIPIVVVIVYVAFGSIVGVLNGNNFGDVFADANSFLGILYLILLANYFGDDFKKINKSFDIIINVSTIVALITIGLFFYSRTFLPQDQTVIVKYMELNDKLQYGLITGLVMSNNYARVYLFNGIFMQIAALVLMVKMVNRNINNNLLSTLKLIILLIGIYVSNTRGFWVGMAIGVVFFICYYLWKQRERGLTIKYVSIAFILLFIFIAILPKTINTENAGGVASGTESAKDRLESVMDFENNISNKVRSIQLKFLMEKVKEKPVLGWGFGAHINEYAEFMKANNYPPVHTSNFELYYVELLFKTGIIGIAILFGYLIIKFVQLVILVFNYKLEYEDEQVIFGWTIGFLAFLASSVTNPYLASLSGFFVLVFESYILETAFNKYLKGSNEGKKWFCKI